MDAGPPPPGGNQDRGPAMMEIMWIQTGFGILIIAMRFMARFLIHKTSWDDWLMLMTLVFRHCPDPTKGIRFIDIF